MPANQTPNYSLNQWEKSDLVLMEDFNGDNAKIDAALSGLSAQVAAKAAQSAVNTLTSKVNKCGNCKIDFKTYTGTGTSGRDNPMTLTFSGKPLLVIVSNLSSAYTLMTVQGDRVAVIRDITSAYSIEVAWSGNSFSIISNNANSQMNALNTAYAAVALIAADQ